MEQPGGQSSAGNVAFQHDRDEKPSAPKEDAQHRDNRKPVEQARRDVEAALGDKKRVRSPRKVPSSKENDGGTRCHDRTLAARADHPAAQIQ